MLAKIAIILGVCIAPVFLVIGFLSAGATGLAGAGCDSPGCRATLDQSSSKADHLLDIGLFGGGGLVLGGIVALVILPRPSRNAPVLPSARVTGERNRQ